MASQVNLGAGILADTGAAYTWGANTYGQLGDGSTTARSSPVAVIGNHSFTEIYCGFNFIAAFKGDSGQFWSMGQGDGGRLGNNSATLSYSSPITVVGGHVFKNATIGYNFSFGLKGGGSVWSWGTNTGGQLGDNSTTGRSSPVAVVGGHSFIQVSGGLATTIALKADGSAWAWGANISGQVGNNTANNSYSSPVAVIGNHSFIKVKTGGSNAVGLKADGSVWAWGYNTNGNCGNNMSGNSYSSPVAVVGNHSFIDISLGGITAANIGETSTIALKADGSVWCWGGNASGQLGDGSTTARSSPVAVVGSHSFNHISAGSRANGALKANGQLWLWGLGDVGRLGDNTATAKSSPVLVLGGFYFAAPHEATLLRQWVNLSQASWHAAARAYININSSSWARIIDTEVQVGGAWKMSY